MTMKLQDVFDRLTFGELSTIAIGGKEHGEVQESDWWELSVHVNTALTKLYRRFPILTREVIIQMFQNIQTYDLHSKHSWMNELPHPKYIIDSDTHPFTDDVLSVRSIHDELGREMWLNDDSEYWRAVMNSDLRIQIPFPDKQNAISVIYKANHRMIYKGANPKTFDINIPESYMEPLLLYVAGRVFSAVTTEGTNEGKAYFDRYEQAVQTIIHEGLPNRDNTIDEKFEIRRWV